MATFSPQGQEIGASATLEKSNQQISILDTSALTDFIKGVVEDAQKAKQEQEEADLAETEPRVLTEGKEDFNPVEPPKEKDIAITATDIPKYGRAFLNTISMAEGTNIDRTYQAIVGLGKDIEGAPAFFEDYSQHPNVVGMRGVTETGKKWFSTAAGRFQITNETWREVAKALNLKDFSPENQDRAAWYLAKKRYSAVTKEKFGSARNLEQDLQAGNLTYIKPALGPTWTGLQTPFNFEKFYARNLQTMIPKTPSDQTIEKTEE